MDNKLYFVVALCSLPTMAAADNTKATSIADTSCVHDIDEVVVASHPKDLQRLRRQAVSSTSLAAKTIDAFAQRDMREVSARVPSFVMPEYGSRYTSAVYVRGIGSRVNSPAIGMYVDGVPLVSKTAFNTHLYDISRIDLLRGPQGTLYGQNAEGGLVRVYTKSPLSYQGTDVKMSIGSHLWRMAEISHYGKADGVGAYSVAAFYNGQNGFQRNMHTGSRADNGNEAGARMKFIRQQTERTTITLTADYQWVRQNGFAYGNYDLSTGLASDPSTNMTNNYRRHLLTTGLNVNYRGHHADVNSTTSYQYLDDHMQMDQDYTSTDYLSLRQRQLMNAITEEFAIKSHATGIWRCLTGAFFSYQWLRTNAPVGFGDGLTQPIAKAIETTIYNSMLKSMTSKGMTEEMAKAVIEKAGGISMNATMAAPGVFKTPQLNAALFHESEVRISPRISASIGLRYDMSHTSIDYDTRAFMTMDANVMGVEAKHTLLSALKNSTSDTFNELLPKVGVTLELGTLQLENNGGKLGNMYVSASKGYRAGGYNIQMFSDILQSELMANRSNAMRGDYEVKHSQDDYNNVNNTIAYKPETSWNYEIGAHINMPGSAVHLDIASYFMQIKNQQLSVMAGNYGFGRMMVNAGRSRSIGGEMTLRGSSLNNALAWAVAYGYTNATFRNYKSGDNDYRGKRVPYIPAHTLSANADYTIITRNSMMKYITVGSGVTGQGSIFWDEANTYSQKFYALLNAHAMFGLKNMKVNIWAKNLTATKYCTFAMDSSASGAKRYFGQKGQPFMFGVDISASL